MIERSKSVLSALFSALSFQILFSFILVFLSKEGARWPRGLGYLYDQLRRAIASVVLNIAEGNARRSATERRRFFEIARASAVEVAACIDLAASFGLMRPLFVASAKSRLTEVSKMLWALIR